MLTMGAMWMLTPIRGAGRALWPVSILGLGLAGCMQPSQGRRVITEPAPPLMEGKAADSGSSSASDWRDPRDDSAPTEAKSPKGTAELAREAALAAAGTASPAERTTYSPSDALLIKDAHSTVDDWHQAAAAGDRDRYLGHFAPDAVYMGTDPSERWDLATFTAYVQEHFQPGAGWSYQPSNRHIMLGSGSTMAWFDEELESNGYGALRGTGVMRRDSDEWKIVHYSMVFTVPNEVRSEVINAVRPGF